MIHIRDATRADATLLVHLIHEMGRHERLPVAMTTRRLVEDGFGATPRFRAVIAEEGTKVAGYALLFDYYSSFQGSGLFLEDLFVRDDFRGRGVGSALLSRIASRAIARGQFGLMFNVLDWNRSALRFFESTGASVLSDRKTLQLTDAALRGIAGGNHGGN